MQELVQTVLFYLKSGLITKEIHRRESLSETSTVMCCLIVAIHNTLHSLTVLAFSDQSY